MVDDRLSIVNDAAHLVNVAGIIFDIQRYSVHDGPGLRTNVFLKGCPLHCGWCANPESQRRAPELALHEHDCMTCGQFEHACPTCWAQRGDDAARSELLGERAAICPTGALHWIGRRATAGEIMAEVRRDAPFYGADGGMTLTGGEPTLQPRLCEALLRLAKLDGIHTAMETTGYATWTVLERLLPHLDMLLYDVKHVDATQHRRHAGVDNRPILDNLRRLTAADARVNVPTVVRVPLIPDFNADAAAMHGLAEYLLTLERVPPVELLPYHALGRAKYAALGRDYPWQAWTRLDDGVAAAMAEILRTRGLSVRLD